MDTGVEEVDIGLAICGELFENEADDEELAAVDESASVEAGPMETGFEVVSEGGEESVLLLFKIVAGSAPVWGDRIIIDRRRKAGDDGGDAIADEWTIGLKGRREVGVV
jgi:hypothetical protein